MKIKHWLGATAWALAGACASAQTLGLSEVMQAAAENFDVAMARGALAAAQADRIAADHAPLPTLSAKAGQIDLQNGVGPGSWLSEKRVDKSLGLDWTWERGNKRDLRVAAAAAGAEAAEADLRETRLQQQAAALSAFYDLQAAQQRLTEVRALADSARQLAELMARRLKAGDVSTQDLARAEIEAGKARLDQQAAEQDRRRAALALQALIARPVDAAAEQPWPAAQPWLETPLPSLEPLLAARSDVQAADARVRAAEHALDGARAQRKSDVTWGVSLDHYPGTSTRQLELRLQMPLQIGYAQEGEIGRAQAQLQQARDLAAKTRLQAEADLRLLWQQTQQAAAALQLHEQELLPRARQVLAQAELAQAKGAMSLSDLIEARRTLRASLLDALAARADFARALGAWQLRQPQ